MSRPGWLLQTDNPLELTAACDCVQIHTVGTLAWKLEPEFEEVMECTSPIARDCVNDTLGTHEWTIKPDL